MISKEQKAQHAREYYQTHKEQFAAYSRAYYQANKTKRAAYNKAYRAAHRAERNAQHRAYYQAHREKCLAQAKAYYQAHKEQVAAYKKAYRQAHKEQIKGALQTVNPRPTCSYPCEDCFFFGVEKRGKLYCAHDKTYSHPVKSPNLQCFMRFQDGQLMWLSICDKPSASGKYRCYPLTH